MSVSYHIERIICPECKAVCTAKVEHTQPFYSYVHNCEKCGYTIMESDWERDKPLILSVRQPWAWLLVNSWKNIENRDWPTKVRGRFLIHASLTMTRADYDACVLFFCAFAPDPVSKLPGRLNLDRGGIVGEAVLLDCVTRHDSEWFTGEYGFVVADAKPLPFRTLAGRLGFFREGTA